jgi:hypothetical protein
MSAKATRERVWDAIGHINSMGHDALERRTSAGMSTLHQQDLAFNIAQDTYASLQAKMADAYYDLADKVTRAWLGE